MNPCPIPLNSDSRLQYRRHEHGTPRPRNETNGCRERPTQGPTVHLQAPRPQGRPLVPDPSAHDPGWERLSDHQSDKLLSALAEGDPTGEVESAILSTELLREVYSAPTLHQAHWPFVRFYGYVADAEVPELARLATTISRWEQEVPSYHTTGISTGPVEAQNLVTEKIRRIGQDFWNFENYRLRLLLHS